jgi:alanine dehydrogenase
MIIGVPREKSRTENRVGLNPFAAARLISLGHEVLVEGGAGEDARFEDPHYSAVGARIAYGREEVLGRADLVATVERLSDEDLDVVRRGTLVCGFQHLAVAPREVVAVARERELTLLGYELVQDAHGDFPIMHPFSDMAGRMVMHIAAHLLQNLSGGRGILLGSLPTVAPATVLILGAGRVGQVAAMQALHLGAHVIVVDSDVHKLRRIHDHSQGQIVTSQAGASRLEKYTSIADLVIGAVHIPGGRAPFLVSREMVAGMKDGSVVIDLSIDQGGCVETSRPTTLDDPTFTVDGVLHYCVPNMTSNIARTASRALAGAALPYLMKIGRSGLIGALREDPGLARGITIYRGTLTQPRLARQLGEKVYDIHHLISQEADQ